MRSILCFQTPNRRSERRKRERSQRREGEEEEEKGAGEGREKRKRQTIRLIFRVCKIDRREREIKF